MLANSSKDSSKKFIFSKVLFKAASSASIVQGFCLLFTKSFFKENLSVVASVILHRFYFSNNTKWLSPTKKRHNIIN